MPRLVFFLLLLLPLLACAQAALAARLPEVQAAGSLKAETPVQGIKKIPAGTEAADTPPTLLAAADPNAGAGRHGVASSDTGPDTGPDTGLDTAESAAGQELAARPDLPTLERSEAAQASQDTAVPDTADKTDKKTAAAIISGSRRPGIIEHQIVRTNREDKPDINLSYPSLGIRTIDANIREWATGIADAFEETFNSPGLYPDENRPVPELWCSYSVSHPSDKALSITFEVWTYTGGSQGNLDVMTLNYSLLTGQRLGLVDIFEDPDAALAIMSAWSRRELFQRLGGMRQEQYLRTGLNPVPENFASLTLTPSGIRINFQPYQVAPGMAGAQKVEIPIEELQPAHPLMLLWGK
ncbi:MAG: RsiV family protein [Desulfovibrio sp.]